MDTRRPTEYTYASHRRVKKPVQHRLKKHVNTDRAGEWVRVPANVRAARLFVAIA